MVILYLFNTVKNNKNNKMQDENILIIKNCKKVFQKKSKYYNRNKISYRCLK